VRPEKSGQIVRKNGQNVSLRMHLVAQFVLFSERCRCDNEWSLTCYISQEHTFMYKRAGSVMRPIRVQYRQQLFNSVGWTDKNKKEIQHLPIRRLLLALELQCDQIWRFCYRLGYFLCFLAKIDRVTFGLGWAAEYSYDFRIFSSSRSIIVKWISAS